MVTANNRERTYSFTANAEGTAVVIEGIMSDIPAIAADILQADTALGRLSRSNVFILKTRGFSLHQLRREFEVRNTSIDEYFPVQCKFDIDRKKYMVEHSDRQQDFKKGQLID